MRNFFANPIISRITGALSAGIGVFIIQHDAKAAGVAAVAFLIYGATHTAATAAANS